MNIKISIDSSKFDKWLLISPPNITRAISNIIKQASYYVNRESKQLAPVDTGRLRNSIATDLRPMSATIEPHVNYAVYVHDGTRFMRARPFMTQGSERAERYIPGIIENELKKVL